MRKILFLLFLAIASQSRAQSGGNTLETNTADQKTLADTAGIPVEYVTKPAKGKEHSPAYFANGRFLKPFMMQTISPDKIKRINVRHRDTVIDGKKYYGMIFMELKGSYQPDKMSEPVTVSLNSLKDQYTNLKGLPTLFTIDGKLINANYNAYQIDKNKILKIIVEPFADNDADNPLWLVKILTKSKENIDEAGKIRIRGNAQDLSLGK